jgi:peptidoglycan/LPS O-acetylase OafA/YrhL
MEQDGNPYSLPIKSAEQMRSQAMATQHRGPLRYFAFAGVIGAALAIPLIVPRSLAVTDDPNPVGYLVILLSFPIGGLIYRLRSRNWPIDETVIQRQRAACFATLLLPFTVALLTGVRAQGLHMTILSGIVSLVLMAGILVSGDRRDRNMS